MEVEEFYQRFQGLDKEIADLNEEVEDKREELRELEVRVRSKTDIQCILKGLKNPPKKDPGKYQAAYYFVSSITNDDAERAQEPTLSMPCYVCEEDKPVVMAYHQVEDSLAGDVWEKVAFTICEKDGVYDLSTFRCSDRF